MKKLMLKHCVRITVRVNIVPCSHINAQKGFLRLGRTVLKIPDFQAQGTILVKINYGEL